MEERQYDLIILGGGCAGLTAGIYAGRSRLRTLILESVQPGGQAAVTNEIANYPGIPGISGPELTQRMLDQARSFGAELRLQEARQVRLAGEWKEVETDDGVLRARTVILATGAFPRQAGFSGEETFYGRGVSYCAACDGPFFRGRDIFVVGGGYSAAEEALYLTRFGKRVTVLVRKDAFRCAPSIAERVLSHPHIQVRFHTELAGISGSQAPEQALLRDVRTGETTVLQASPEDGSLGVFVFVGRRPATDLFRGQVELDGNGYVRTNQRLETGIPGVFAAGDLRVKELRQLVTAAADGAIAAARAEQYLAEQAGTPGGRETF